MNVLFVVGGGNLNTQIAQIALCIGLYKKGVNIHLIGHLNSDVIEYLNQQEDKITYQSIYPIGKIDKKYQLIFEKIILEKKIQIVHFVSGKASRSGLLTLKKYPKVKAVIYFGSVSLHWHDISAYLTYLSPRIDAIIGNSNFVSKHVKKQLFGKNKLKVKRVYKGYDPKWFANTIPFDYGKIGIPKQSIIVCSIGNHRKIKGTRYFLDSSNYLSTTKDVHYILIGENTDNKCLTKIKKNSKISKNIHVLGKRDDVPSLLAGADIYVQTSLSEGFGRAISEAMSVGKPIVMTNAGGCTELIDKNSGIIVPLKNAKKVGAAISKLTNDDSLRIKMGHNAKERISTVYHIDKTTEDTYKLYNDLLNE